MVWKVGGIPREKTHMVQWLISKNFYLPTYLEETSMDVARWDIWLNFFQMKYILSLIQILMAHIIYVDFFGTYIFRLRLFVSWTVQPSIIWH